MYLRPGHERREVLHLAFMRDLRDHQKRLHRLRVWNKIEFRKVGGTDTQPVNVSIADAGVC